MHVPVAPLNRLRALEVRPASLGTLLCLAVIGVELAVLVSVLPDTVLAWWRVESTADFRYFYRYAGPVDLPRLYSPAVSLLLHPLTYLPITTAYRVYVAVNALAFLGVAYLAQRQVRPLEAKVAVALGVLSVPQMHWALQMGHFTPVLALALLGGLLAARKQPLLAGLCFAVLVLKPQYVLVPAAFLLWTRNWRALASMTAGIVVLELAGFLAVGMSQLGPYIASFVRASGQMRDAMSDIQHANQYTWHGFLVSAGLQPSAIVAFDLILLSAGLVWLVWLRGGRMSASSAAAFGVLLVAPYAYFYDWGMLAVGVVLLLAAEVRGRQVLPVIAFGMYLALVAAQRATPYPMPPELFGADLGEAPATATNGVYWITPLTLAVVGFLALVPRAAEAAGPDRLTLRLPIARPVLARVALAGALAVVPAAYLAAAFVGHVAPFTQGGTSSSEAVRRVPVDFPLPQDHHLEDAGSGAALAYRVEWSSEEPVSEVAGMYRRMVDGGTWELMLGDGSGTGYNVRIARFTPYGEMTHWALLDVSDDAEGSRISLEFSSIQALAEAAR